MSLKHDGFSKLNQKQRDDNSIENINYGFGFEEVWLGGQGECWAAYDVYAFDFG